MQINQIEVPPRFRDHTEALDKHISDLADSISRRGLIHPIVVSGQTLIAGYCRLMACKKLGHDEILVREYGILNELERRTIELEENIKRKSFEFREEVAAKAELLRLRQLEFGVASSGPGESGYSMADLAAELGESKANISRDIMIASALEAVPELAKEKNKGAVYRKLRHLSNLVDMIQSGGGIKEGNVITDLRQGNCLGLIHSLPPESVNLILTDPPYGLNLDLSKRVDYLDTPDHVFDLLRRLSDKLFQVLCFNSHLYMFCASQHFHITRNILLDAGFSVRSSPLIFLKGSSQHFDLSDFMESYEMIVFAQKGTRTLNMASTDVLGGETHVGSTSRFHPVQKPIEIMKSLIELSSLPGDLILDPFAGSATTLIAARELGRSSIGFELDPGYYSAGLMRLEGKGVI